jgi:hypothetical protein
MVPDGIDREPAEFLSERRGEKRRQKRLGWGKTLSIQNEFLSECMIANLTSKGACLRIARRVFIPRYFLLYDDNTGVVLEGEVIWRKDMELGCKISATSHIARAAIANRMRAKYYGV